MCHITNVNDESVRDININIITLELSESKSLL